MKKEKAKKNNFSCNYYTINIAWRNGLCLFRNRYF